MMTVPVATKSAQNTNVSLTLSDPRKTRYNGNAAPYIIIVYFT
jgi:hypothetical protein